MPSVHGANDIKESTDQSPHEGGGMKTWKVDCWEYSTLQKNLNGLAEWGYEVSHIFEQEYRGDFLYTVIYFRKEPTP